MATSSPSAKTTSPQAPAAAGCCASAGGPGGALEGLSQKELDQRWVDAWVQGLKEARGAIDDDASAQTPWVQAAQAALAQGASPHAGRTPKGAPVLLEWMEHQIPRQKSGRAVRLPWTFLRQLHRALTDPIITPAAIRARYRPALKAAIEVQHVALMGRLVAHRVPLPERVRCWSHVWNDGLLLGPRLQDHGVERLWQAYAAHPDARQPAHAHSLAVLEHLWGKIGHGCTPERIQVWTQRMLSLPLSRRGAVRMGWLTTGGPALAAQWQAYGWGIEHRDEPTQVALANLRVQALLQQRNHWIALGQISGVGPITEALAGVDQELDRWFSMGIRLQARDKGTGWTVDEAIEKMAPEVAQRWRAMRAAEVLGQVLEEAPSPRAKTPRPRL